MWDQDDLSFAADEFSGRVRLFPLPNLVMFPNVMQPLHIFEPRYREMVEEALAGDRLLAMGLLEPGWENDYDGRPEVARTACLGKIATYQRVEDGKFNVLLLGLRRIRLVRELPPQRAFREWEVDVLEDVQPLSPAEMQVGLQRKLLAGFQALLPKLPVESESLDDLLRTHVPLGMLTDIMGYTLDLGLEVKQSLLAEVNVVHRAQILLNELSLITAGRPSGRVVSDFPPKFSSN